MPRTSTYSKNKGKNKGRSSNKRTNRKTTRDDNLNKSDVKNIVKTVLDKRIEDKYLIDGGYIQLNNSYNVMHNTILKELTPTINTGSAHNERIGDKVLMKSLTVQVRLRPRFHFQPLNSSQGQAQLATALIPQVPDCKVYLFKIARDMIPTDPQLQTQFLNNLQSYLKVKFKQDGVFDQELQRDDGQKVIKSVVQIGKVTKLPVRFQVAALPSYAQNVDGQVICSPKYAHKYCYARMNKKLTFALNNQPIQHKYFLYAQFDNAWRNNVFDPPQQPDDFSIRVRWLYEG